MGDPNKNGSSAAPAVIERPEAGGEIVRPAEEAGAGQALGETEVSPEEHAAEARTAERRAMFDNRSDALLTFAEGMVDAVSLGLIHETGEAADIRRDVNSSAAFAGEMVGTAVGLKVPGPLKLVAEGGEAAGAKAAKLVLGDVSEGSRAGIALKAAQGAGEMSAMMGAASVGHQITDTVLDDKEFSGYAVLEEAGLGAVLGGGMKFLEGTFGRAASRYDIGAQGGLLDPTSPAAQNVAESIKGAKGAWDAALEVHERRLGALRALQKDGVLGNYINDAPQFMADREVALKAAKAAQARLEATSFEGMVDADPKRWSKWHNAMEDYQDRLNQLDEAMQPRAFEQAQRVQPGVPGEAQAGTSGMVGGISEVVQLPNSDIAEMNELMKDPHLQAQYEAIYGRPFEPVERPTGIEGEENLGGRESPTTGNKTPVQSGRARAPISEEPTPPAGAPPETPLHDRFDVTDVDAEMASEAAPERPTPSEPNQPWTPSAPKGRFNPAEFTPTTLAAEGMGGKFIPPSGEAQALDNALSGSHPDLARTQFKFSDGYFAPAADVVQNARAFSDFMERMRVDTPMEGQPGQAQPTPVETRTPVIRRAAPTFDGTQPTPLTRAPELGKTPVVMDERRIPHEPAAGQGRLKASLREAQRAEARQAVRNYIDQWYADSKVAPRLSPGDRAAAQLRRVLDDIRATDKGRGVSASSTAIGDLLGLPIPRSALGAQLNDLYAMRRVAELAADASKGTVMKGVTKNKTLDWIVRRAGGKLGASVAGGVAGHMVGGPLGYAVGAALATRYAGFAGRAAGIAGKTYQRCLKAAAGLLKGSRSTVIARAIAGNRPYVYSDAGPIKDPIQRIQEIRRVASGGDVPRAVVASAGDLNVVHPELVQNLVASAMQRIQYLAQAAPQIQYDSLGRPMPLSVGEQRRFFETENAVNDLESILAAVQNGSVTRIQAEVLRSAHAPAFHKIAAFLVQDPEVMATLSREKLKVAEMVLGAPLTPGADPLFVARQQVGWTYPQPGAPGQPAQALSIPGKGGPPSAGPRAPRNDPKATPTPTQSTTGRAPGN
jgi:hypothetical protein